MLEKQWAAPQRLPQGSAEITAALSFCHVEYGISSLEIKLRLLRNVIGIHWLFSTGKKTVTKAEAEGKAKKTHCITT